MVLSQYQQWKDGFSGGGVTFEAKAFVFRERERKTTQKTNNKQTKQKTQKE